jgi:hypothetical protein
MAAEGRNDAVEALVRERHVLRVAFDPLDVDAGLGCTTPGVLEQLGREIQADDLRAATRRRNRDVASRARARADVHQVETRTEVDALEDDRAHRFDQPRVGVPVTGRPYRTCPLPEVRRSRHRAKLTDPRRVPFFRTWLAPRVDAELSPKPRTVSSCPHEQDDNLG